MLFDAGHNLNLCLQDAFSNLSSEFFKHISKVHHYFVFRPEAVTALQKIRDEGPTLEKDVIMSDFWGEDIVELLDQSQQSGGKTPFTIPKAFNKVMPSAVVLTVVIIFCTSALCSHFWLCVDRRAGLAYSRPAKALFQRGGI